MNKMGKVICCCCGRQVIIGSRTSDKYVAPGMCPRVGFRADECCCDDCSKYMDEDGLFPEERIGSDELG